MKTGWKGALGKEAPEAGAAPMTAYATMVAVAVAAVAFIVNAGEGGYSTCFFGGANPTMRLNNLMYYRP